MRSHTAAKVVKLVCMGEMSGNHQSREVASDQVSRPDGEMGGGVEQAVANVTEASKLQGVDEQ